MVSKHPCGAKLPAGGTGKGLWAFVSKREYTGPTFPANNLVQYWLCGEEALGDVALCKSCQEALGILW